MKTLEEKKLLVKMMKMFGQPVDEELVESIRREEELRKAFFGEEVQETKIVIEKQVEPIVQPVIEAPVKILKADESRGISKHLQDLSKEQLIDVIEEMTTDVDIMELYELDNDSLIYLIRELSKEREIIAEEKEEKTLVELAAENIDSKENIEDNNGDSLQTELETLKKSLDLLTKRFNTSIATGSGGGAVRMSDLDDLIARQDIIPDLDEVFSLGSPTRRFKDLFLSGNTITLGATTLKSDSSGGGLAIGPSEPNEETPEVSLAWDSFKSLSAPIVENSTIVEENYTISENKNANSLGPIKLNKTVTLTIPKTSRWKIFA